LDFSLFLTDRDGDVITVEHVGVSESEDSTDPYGIAV
jgi:hypothetical protein